MKKMTITAMAALTAFFALSAMEFPYVADFSGKTKPLLTGKVENNAISSNGEYSFSILPLPDSEKILKISMQLSGKDGATFGAILYDDSIQETLMQVTWNMPVNGKKDYSFHIPLSKLDESSKLVFYHVSKKGSLAITKLQVEQVDKIVKQTAKKAQTHKSPYIALPFKSDFTQKQTGFNFSGKKVNGKGVVTKEYDFCSILVPPSDKTVGCIIKASATPEAAMGVIIYEMNKKGSAGRVLQKPFWGKTFPAKSKDVGIGVKASKSPRIVVLYNTTKKGSITIDEIVLMSK